MRQKLGQHFLISQKILERIAVAACGDHCPSIVEIGPGQGALTERLLAHAEHVAAIELDPALADMIAAKFPQVELVRGDALEVDFNRWPDSPIAGNLPYYVATAIIERVVRLRRRAVFLIQKEVAQRVAAGPGSRDYGYLSVATQLFARAEIVFGVKPGAFRPPPKVDSSVIRLTPRDGDWGVADVDEFLQFLSRCFQHKRKTLRNNLVDYYDRRAVENLPQAGARAEQIPLPEFAEIFRQIRGVNSIQSTHELHP